jgi:hypothetical protein
MFSFKPGRAHKLSIVKFAISPTRLDSKTKIANRLWHRARSRWDRVQFISWALGQKRCTSNNVIFSIGFIEWLFFSTFLSSLLKLMHKELIIRNYNNGCPYLILFPDGSGTVFYQSGRVAISIIVISQGMLMLSAFSDYQPNPTQIASFDPFGNGFCDFASGQLRLVLSPLGGNCLFIFIFFPLQSHPIFNYLIEPNNSNILTPILIDKLVHRHTIRRSRMQKEALELVGSQRACARTATTANRFLAQ